ncbi:Zinc finger, CCCH-type [Corchorus capsularis]|uniref:Zinc finger, CCCH-type n=1 Tax=Corchorus capsularis TaxID=210143 RepID=A0A1R3HA99_COCAP|nr:Zinc finger, CCCH-type [Corchorus capsularis]
MEEPQEPHVEAPFSFPPLRRSHLRSGTYHNLVRFISLCYGDSSLATAPPIIPLHRTPGEPVGDDVREPLESIVPDNMQQAQEGNVVNGGFEGAAFKDRRLSNTQMVVDEIEQIMRVEEDEDSKPSEKVENQGFLFKPSAMHEKTEIQQKEMELEKFVCTNDGIPSPVRMVEDEEPEEGEIFGDIQHVNESVDILIEDALLLQKKEEEKQDSGCALDGKHLRCNEVSTAYDKDLQTAQIANRVTEVDPKGNERAQMVSKLGKMHRKEGSGKVIKQSGSENQVIKSIEKKDVGVCNKNKQGQSPAKKKEKKKRNKRKRRAEKNKQLGVKRLKLETVLKPRVVSYCRHYLKGRCYEGEKCKYSHDTVPLTKSQPCCHFARQSCMKGDECPFDHELSKYPCTSFMTKGSCVRGDACLFSHKMSREENVASTTNARDLQLKPSLHSDSNMRLDMSRNVEASSCSAGASSQQTKQIVADTQMKTPDLARKGVNYLFHSKSCIAEPSKLSQGGSSQKMKESDRVGIQSNQSTPVVNSTFASKRSVAELGKFSEGSSSLKMSKAIQASESGTIQIVNGSPKRKTEVVPRGINFLSVGKSSLEDSTSKVSLALYRGDGYKQQPAEKNQTTRSALSMDQRKGHPAVVPVGIDFPTFGKSCNSRINEASIPSRADMVNNGSLQKSNYVSDKQHYLSPISYKLPVSPQTSGQSSGRLLHKNTPNSTQKALISTLEGDKKFSDVNSGSPHEGQHLSDKQCNSNLNPWKIPAHPLGTGQTSEKMSHTNTPNSAQKGVMSTLAFAAKCESRMKKNQSNVSSGHNSETRESKISEGSRDLEKTSKLLEFLSGFSSKRKQI